MRKTTEEIICDNCGKKCLPTMFYETKIDFCDKNCDMKYTLSVLKKRFKEMKQGALEEVDEAWKK